MQHEKEQIKSIIFKSGNTFHCKVLKFLKENGWTVLISPYYTDNISSKPREIDLIAEKAFVVHSHISSRPIGTINIKTYIECKHIPNKTVFWFHDKDKNKAENLVIHTTPMERNNTYTKKHHYLAGDDRVAKLFADEKQSSADGEVFYKALNQSLNAMIYHRERGTIIDLPDSRKGYIKRIVNYPVILCNSFDNICRVDIDKDIVPAKISDNFQLEVNYAYTNSKGNNLDEYFLIDVVNYDLFEKYLKQLESDVENFNVFLEEN